MAETQGHRGEVLVALVPPARLWAQTVAIKEQHFKPSLRAKGRHPFPHISIAQFRQLDTSLAEFVTEIEAAIAGWDGAVAKCLHSPLHTTFDDFATFGHGKKATVYVRDPESRASGRRVRDLCRALAGVAQQRGRGGGSGAAARKGAGAQGVSDVTVRPHIALGLVDKSQSPRLIREYSAVWQPVTFDVTHVYVLTRQARGPWVFDHALPLFPGQAVDSPIPVGSHARLADQAAPAAPGASGDAAAAAEAASGAESAPATGATGASWAAVAGSVTAGRRAEHAARATNPAHLFFSRLAEQRALPVFVEGPGSGETRGEQELQQLRVAAAFAVRQRRARSGQPVVVFGQGDRPNKGVSGLLASLLEEGGVEGALVVVDDQHLKTAHKRGFAHRLRLGDCLALLPPALVTQLQARISERCARFKGRKGTAKYALLQEAIKAVAKLYFPQALVLQTLPRAEIPPGSVAAHCVHGPALGYISEPELLAYPFEAC